MRATVKRVAKRRSKIKTIRPTTKGAAAGRAIVPEIVEPMPADVSTPMPPPVAGSAVPTAPPWWWPVSCWPWEPP